MLSYIGIDLGGTYIRTGAVRADGKILEMKQQPTECGGTIDIILDRIVAMTRSLSVYSDCRAAGIGMCGTVDEKGIVLSSVNLPGLNGRNLQELLQEKLQIPCRAVNDANAAGLAEAVFGAGAEYQSIVYVTVSTGIGGALIINQKIIAGSHGAAGEFSNIRLGSDCQPFIMGGDCCGRKLMEFARDQILNQGISNAGDVFIMAEQNQKQAAELIDRFSSGLAQVFAAISAVYDPDCFILGGGLMKQKRLFLPTVISKYQKMVLKEQMNTPFLSAGINEPGVVGAAAAAIKKMEEETVYAK